ncbi:MAG: SIS domain-containing protein [Planctomycetota bacterium]
MGRKLHTDFLAVALDAMDRLVEQNDDALEAAGDEIAGLLAADGRLLLFGCGHSGLVAQDAYYRAGGLRQARALFAPRVGLDRVPVEETSRDEKAEGWIVEALAAEEIGRRDVLIVIGPAA